jgi:hypothetical protein
VIDVEYFEYENLKIPVIEHFQDSGKQLIELIQKLIWQDIEKDSNT